MDLAGSLSLPILTGAKTKQVAATPATYLI